MPSPVRLPGELLSWQRIRVGCAILLAIEIAVFLFMAAGTHGLIVPLPKPTSTDFVSFYAAGSLADAGTPELAYDQATHYAAEQRATQEGIEYNFFYYPPLRFCCFAQSLRICPISWRFWSLRRGLYYFICSSRAIYWAIEIPPSSCRFSPFLRYYGHWAWGRMRF